MRSNEVVSVVVADDGSAITFTAHGAGSDVLNVSRLSEGIIRRAVIHGLVQKVRDAAAQNQRTATPASRRAAMQNVIETLLAGAWSAKREGGTRIGADETLLSRALAELYPAKSPDFIRAKVTGMRPEERRALMLTPSVKPVVDRLRAEAAEGVDAEALLADFDE